MYSESEINEWINKNKSDKRLFPSGYDMLLIDKNWLIDIDGAKFISVLFTELTGAKLSYAKILHPVSLTDWLIENSFDDLQEYQVILTEIFKVIN